MNVKLISIGFKNDSSGTYSRHTDKYIFLNVDSVEYKFNYYSGKQVGYFNTKNKGYWVIFTSDLLNLKEHIKTISDINKE